MPSADKQPSYTREAIELTLVAVEYCTFLERSNQKERSELVDTMTKLLPLLYLKATLLPSFASLEEETYLEDFVTEDEYDFIRSSVSRVMADKDDYLDVFVEDMKYSDTPILATVSENLADIYQALKNFVMRYKHASDDSARMEAAIEVKEDCKYNWGQKVANVLRALHEVQYSPLSQDDDLTM